MSTRLPTSLRRSVENRPNDPVDICCILYSSMFTPVIAFDPGYSTGYAALNSSGAVVHTEVIPYDNLVSFVWRIRAEATGHLVVIEIGPTTQHHSPITRRAEATLRESFPNAALVLPSQYKRHPAARIKVLAKTQHERDAARLGHWFQVKRSSNEENSPRAHSSSPGH